MSPAAPQLRFLRDAANAAFSRGYGYEPQPLGKFDCVGVGDYFLDLRLKTDGSTSDDRLGPADLAQLALGWWGHAIRFEKRGADSRFLELASQLLATGTKAPDGLRWPYLIHVPKYGLEPPWNSALAQGQIASVFVRAFLKTGDDAYAEAARLAVGPLVAAESDLVTQTPDGPILEEVPAFTQSHILNGWIYALWGLWEVRVALQDDLAGETFQRSSSCLHRMLDLYDLGWWTRYGLQKGRFDDVAKPFYHRLHADQAEVMYRLTGRPGFASAATRWRLYDTPRNQLRAVATKGLHVVRSRA